METRRILRKPLRGDGSGSQGNKERKTITKSSKRGTQGQRRPDGGEEKGTNGEGGDLEG